MVYPMRSILMEFNNNTLCYRPTFSSTKKLRVFCCLVFFFPSGALPTEHLWRRDKRICTNPFYMNQIFMLYPLQALSSSNLWNVISDLNTQARLNQLPFELYYRLQRIFIHLYYRHMKTLWPSHGILCYKAYISPKSLKHISGKSNTLILPCLCHNLMSCHHK